MKRLRIASGLLLLALSFGSVAAVDSVAAPAAPAVAAPAPAPDLTGEWSGYWMSTSKGHTGPLKASFSKVGENCYRVRFKGRFAKIIPFRYTPTLHVVGTGDGTVQFAGQESLGPVFGKFTYTATATATTFDANFSAGNDCGKFVLTRCGCEIK